MSHATGDFRVVSGKVLFTKVMVRLNRAVDVGSIDEDSLYLMGENGRLVREVQVRGRGKLLFIRLPNQCVQLLKPLVLVMTPGVRDSGGKPLVNGYVKGFNIHVRKPLRRNRMGWGFGFLFHHGVFISDNPHVEIDPWLFFLHPRNLKRKLYIAGGKPEQDETADWNTLKNHLEAGHLEKINQLETRKSGSAGSKPWFTSTRRIWDFFCNELHYPEIEIEGIRGGQTVSQPVTPTIHVSDPDGDLWFYHAFLDFKPYTSGARIDTEGQHWLLVIAVDRWHKGTVKLIRFTIEKPQTLPEFVSLSPSEDITVNEAQLTIQGDVQYATSVTINGPTVALQNNRFTHAVTLQPGDSLFNVIASDAWDRTAERTFTVTYIPDQNPPQLTVAAPADGAYSAVPSVSVTGTVTDESGILYVRVNNLPAQLNGNDFVYNNFPLAEGENTLTVTSEDEFGNKASVTRRVILDGVKPVVVVTQPAPDAYFNLESITVGGRVEDVSAITLTLDGQSLALADNHFETTFALTEGTNHISLQAIDAAGNTTLHQLDVYADFTNPTIAITSPADHRVSKEQTVTVTGQITDAHPMSILLGLSPGGTEVQGELIGGNFYFRNLPLAEGENTLSFEARDRAGNVAQNSLTLHRDTTPPVLTVSAPVTGTSIAVPSVQVQGAVSDGHFSALHINGTHCPVQDGQFSHPLNLAEGVNTITVTASDSAGNQQTRALTLTVDTGAPFIHILQPQNNTLANTANLTVSGTADDPALAAVRVNGQTATLEGNTFTFNLALQEGENQVLVEAEDAVGNISTREIAVTRDTVSPQIVSVTPADQATGVPLNTIIRVEFSEPVAPASLSNQNITLEKDGQILPCTPAVDGSAVILDMGALPDGTSIGLHVTAGVTDPAGNPLQAPYAGSFVTLDTTPPNAPQVDPVPGKTSSQYITLTGAAETGTTVSVSGGLNRVDGDVDPRGKFSISVPLKSNQLNQLCLTAADDAGNLSNPNCVSTTHREGEFTVLDAQIENTGGNTAIRVIFSRPVNTATLTGARFTVSTAEGPRDGVISIEADNTEGVFTLAADLSSTAVMVEVKTGVTDSAGVALSYPFTKVFNSGSGGEIIAQGEVYDDGTGRPLGGALVRLVDIGGTPPAAPAPSTISTSEGKYVLVLPAGQCVLEISKTGYTRSFRTAVSVSGFGTTLLDARLSPVAAETKTLRPGGGTIASGPGIDNRVAPGLLVYNSGAVTSETAAVFTAVGPQALLGRLPSGWSPPAVFDFRIPGEPSAALLTPGQLRVTNRWPEAETFAPVLARWDETQYQWVAVAHVSVSPEELTAVVRNTGQYAFLIGDTHPAAPPEVVLDQPVPAVQDTPAVIPAGVAAGLGFDPEVIYPGDTTSARLTLTAAAGITSGVPVQARVMERHELLTGSMVEPVPYTADLTAYSFGGTTSVVDVNLAPDSQIRLGELKIGSLKADMVRYSAGSLGMVVGPEGGTVSGEGGSSVILEAGAVNGPIAVRVKKVEPAALTTAPPPGFEVVGAIDLSLGGALLLKPAKLSLALTQQDIDLVGEAQLLLVRLEKTGYRLDWVLTGRVALEASAAVSVTEAAGGLPFNGVVRGGSYLFLKALAPVGFISGNVNANGQPLAGALVSAEQHQLKSVSHHRYVQLGFEGSNQLTALNLETNDSAVGTAAIQNPGETVTLDLDILPTGPEITALTPEHGAVEIPLDTVVTFIFSEPVDASTFNPQTVFFAAGAAAVPGVLKLGFDGKQGEFVPNAPLPPDSDIDITVTAGLKDIHGSPMAQVFTARFHTVDILPPETDYSKIFLHMPVDGTAAATGAAGAVEPGATVVVFNQRTGKAVTVTALSDGSFSAAIEALFSDSITITVIDGAGNETLLANKPFTGPDGKQVVLGMGAGEFTSSEGLGIKIEAGTFSEPVLITLSMITDPTAAAPMPGDYEGLNTFQVDLGGHTVQKPFKLSIPAPPGFTPGNPVFIAHEVYLLGEKKWMVVDSTSLKEGRIETNSPPWPGCRAGGIYAMMINQTYQTAFASGMMGAAGLAAYCADLVFIAGPSQEFIMPVPVNKNVTLTVRDMTTGEKVYFQELPGPTQEGQVYDYGPVSNDNIPPAVMDVSGITTMSFRVTPGVIRDNGNGITITPQMTVLPGGETVVGGIEVEGATGTTVTSGFAENTGTVRLYRLEEVEVLGQSKKKYLPLPFQPTVNSDGSFNGTVTVAAGDALLLVVEKGDIPLDNRFKVTFSEPLHTMYAGEGTGGSPVDIPIGIYESDGTSEWDKIETGAQLSASGTEVMIKPWRQLKENRQYILKFDKVRDRSGNELELRCDFRTKASARFNSLDNCVDVYETLLIGGRLFVAAGEEGVKVYDVSDPTERKLLVTQSYAGQVRALALYTDPVDGEKKLVIAGGGAMSHGFIKIADISSLFEADDLDPDNDVTDAVVQEKTLRISDPVGMDIDTAGGLLDGSPWNVSILDNYAFVAVLGGGMMMVDLQLMRPENDPDAIIGYWDHDEYVNDVKAFKRLEKNPADPEGPRVTNFYVAMLIDYFGVKILKVNDPDQPEPWGYYSLGTRRHVKGLEVALDYWVDYDKDGRRGPEEDADETQDKEETFRKRNITAEDEERDLLFFALPSEGKIYVLDFTQHPGDGGQLTLKKQVPLENSSRIADMVLLEDEQRLYVTDGGLGLVIVDVSFPGDSLDINSGEAQRILAVIQTSGSSRFGLAIDEELHTAYVGQMDKGVDIIKLANPELKFVYFDGGIYREAERIAPVELLAGDNPADKYPGEIHVMALLPGGAGIKNDLDPENGSFYVTASLWSLNKQNRPIIPWDPQQKTFIRELKLYRFSNDPGDPRYNMYLSLPVQVTVNPEKKLLPEEEGKKQLLLSGDRLWAHLAPDMVQEVDNAGSANTFYLDRQDCLAVGDNKPSIRADLVDRVKNLDKAAIDNNLEVEKANSPARNPSVYSGVFLHSGEFALSHTDMHIEGRGFDFAFTRTYRSQGIYSGVLGWGWDHNYNKRLLEMHGGDVMYYDGSGRRERFEARGGDVITGYTAPAEWTVQLDKTADGAFRLMGRQGEVEYFDARGKLFKIRDRNGNVMEFFYDTGGQLTAVMDTMGRMIRFQYYDFLTETGGEGTENGRHVMTSGRLKSITDFSGRTLVFSYDPLTGDLLEANFEGRTRSYLYVPEVQGQDDLKLKHNLDIYTGPRGVNAVNMSYTGEDKVENQLLPDAFIHFTALGQTAAVIDAEGNVKDYTHDAEGHPLSVAHRGYPVTEFSYLQRDGKNLGLVDTVTYPEGNKVKYGYYTPVNGQEVRSGANIISITGEPDPVRSARSGPKEPAVFTYEKHTNQVTSISYPNGLTVNHQDPDGNGNFKTVTTNIPGIGYSYTYNGYGQIASETDPLGRLVEYEYHPETAPGGNEATEANRSLDPGTGGYLKKTISPLVTHNFTEYDRRGNLETYDNTHGVTGTYVSDVHDRLKTEDVTAAFSLSPLSYKGTYDYDGSGNMLHSGTSSGSGAGLVNQTTDYTYTPRNMLHTQTDTGRGVTTTYGYDKNDNLESVSNGLDSISFSYNDRDLVETVRLGSAPGVSTFYYDNNGNMQTSNDPYGHATTYQYDGFDRLWQVTDPLNNRTRFVRTQLGNTMTVQRFDTANALLRETVKVNDPLGRMTQYEVKVPGGTAEVYDYSYENAGKTVHITDTLGRTRTVKKNDLGQVYEELDPAGNKIEYFYEDGRGNMTRKLETEIVPGGTPKTYETEYAYNAFNKAEEIKEHTGESQPLVTRFTYDSRGNLTGTVDAEGNTISHHYDAPGRKERTEKHFNNGTSVTTTFTYYPNDLLKTIADDKGNITQYEYDDRKRSTKIIYPDETFIQYTYTEREVDGVKYREVIEKQRNGTVVSSLYDKMGRLSGREITPSAATEGTGFENYEYDGLSRVTKMVNDFSVVERTYDSLNRVTGETQMGELVKYSYGVLNNLRTMTLQYPNQRILQRDFDILDRMSKIKQGQEVVSDVSHIGRSFRKLSQQFGNGDAITYLYDQGRRLTSKETRNQAENLINTYVYGYNKVHMKNFEQRGHDGDKGDVFTYDEVYRLTGVKFNSPEPTNPATSLFETSKTVHLDKVDNILKIVKTQGQDVSEITTTMEDNQAKLSQYTTFDGWALSYDLNGNTTQKGGQSFYYDYRNQLVRAVDNGVSTEFTYDALGRRIEKSTGSETVKYFYDGKQVIEERDGSNAVLKQYVYGSGIDEILRMDQYTGATATPYYYHTNAIGSVTAVTDGSGTLVERVTYDIYGMPTITDHATDPQNPTIVNHSVIGNDILFQGRRYDGETNLYYYRARYYDPIMGRFLQTDPLGYKDSMNLYQGFNMNGANYSDPLGESINYLSSQKVDDMMKYAASHAYNIDMFNMAVTIAIRKGAKPVDIVRAYKKWGEWRNEENEVDWIDTDIQVSDLAEISGLSSSEVLYSYLERSDGGSLDEASPLLYPMGFDKYQVLAAGGQFSGDTIGQLSVEALKESTIDLVTGGVAKLRKLKGLKKMIFENLAENVISVTISSESLSYGDIAENFIHGVLVDFLQMDPKLLKSGKIGKVIKKYAEVFEKWTDEKKEIFGFMKEFRRELCKNLGYVYVEGYWRKGAYIEPRVRKSPKKRRRN